MSQPFSFSGAGRPGPTREKGLRLHQSGSPATTVGQVGERRTVRTITREKLRHASSEDEVVEIVREFVSDWLPEEIGRLPEACRPRKVRDGEDLDLWAWDLARACISFDIDPVHLPLVEEMDAFIGHSCRRVAEIRRSETHPQMPLAGTETRSTH